jgi:hypothetical protein
MHSKVMLLLFIILTIHFTTCYSATPTDSANYTKNSWLDHESVKATNISWLSPDVTSLRAGDSPVEIPKPKCDDLHTPFIQAYYRNVLHVPGPYLPFYEPAVISEESDKWVIIPSISCPPGYCHGLEYVIGCKI